MKYNKINFINEYIFSNLPNRRFDFAIFKNDKLCCLIEYDGKQHFINSKGCFDQSYDDIHKNDLKKNKFCFKIYYEGDDRTNIGGVN